MSVLIALALATSINTCSWKNPGADPYMGRIDDAVQNYTDIAPAIRAQLIEKINARKYDDIATIKRDTIVGKSEYENLSDMHFGQGRQCHTVDRSAWKDAQVERGLVYCVGDTCVIIPTVCRNVSRVTRKAQRPVHAHVEPMSGLPSSLPIDMQPIPSLPTFGMTNSGSPLSPPVSAPFSQVPFAPQFPIYIPPLPPAHVPGVPEPRTWLLFLAGIAAISFAKYRQKS